MYALPHPSTQLVVVAHPTWLQWAQHGPPGFRVSPWWGHPKAGCSTQPGEWERRTPTAPQLHQGGSCPTLCLHGSILLSSHWAKRAILYHVSPAVTAFLPKPGGTASISALSIHHPPPDPLQQPPHPTSDGACSAARWAPHQEQIYPHGRTGGRGRQISRWEAAGASFKVLQGWLVTKQREEGKQVPIAAQHTSNPSIPCSPALGNAARSSGRGSVVTPGQGTANSTTSTDLSSTPAVSSTAPGWGHQSLCSSSTAAPSHNDAKGPRATAGSPRSHSDIGTTHGVPSAPGIPTACSLQQALHLRDHGEPRGGEDPRAVQGVPRLPQPAGIPLPSNYSLSLGSAPD